MLAIQIHLSLPAPDLDCKARLLLEIARTDNGRRFVAARLGRARRLLFASFGDSAAGAADGFEAVRTLRGWRAGRMG